MILKHSRSFVHVDTFLVWIVFVTDLQRMRLLYLLGPLLLVVLLDGANCSTMPPPSDVPKEVLVEVENNLLSLFGFRKRPKIDKTKIFIPEAMLKLYEQQVGHPYDTVAIPRPGLHTNNANTIRSFTHIGKFSISKVIFTVLIEKCIWAQLLYLTSQILHNFSFK